MDSANSNGQHAALAALLCTLALLPGTAVAVEVAGVRFVDRVALGSDSLVLNGVGIRRVTLFNIKAYVAGLYVRERTRAATDILRPDRSKYFVAVMKRDVARDDGASAFRKGVERSAGRDAGAIRYEIAAFERWIPSMREGQQLTVAFAPNIGVVVKSTAKNTAFQGSIRFGTALFGMWIGPRAIDADLRESLLAGRPGTDS